MGFQKATKKQAKLRLAIVGTAGTGKTWTALEVATGLKGDGRVALIDTERGSASLYSDRFDFDVQELETFAPSAYVKAIKEAEAGGYPVLVIDGLSPAWNGTDGILEQVDNAQARGGNKMRAWADATPKHKELIDTILQCKCHVIATMRAKTRWILKEEETPGGKTRTTVEKAGLGAEQREGFDYEFGVVGIMRHDHSMVIDKTRCSAIADKVLIDPGPVLVEKLGAWLNDGAPDENKPIDSTPDSSGPTDAQLKAELIESIQEKAAAKDIAIADVSRWAKANVELPGSIDGLRETLAAIGTKILKEGE